MGTLREALAIAHSDPTFTEDQKTRIVEMLTKVPWGYVPNYPKPLEGNENQTY